MSYYKTINGVKYDASIIETADKLTNNNAGNNPISVDDAKELLKTVMDGAAYSDVEKKTMAYVRRTYKWTDKADESFRSEIRKWAASKRKK